MSEFIATVTTPKGGTETVIVKANSPEGAALKLTRMGYTSVRNVTRN